MIITIIIIIVTIIIIIIIIIITITVWLSLPPLTTSIILFQLNRIPHVLMYMTLNFQELGNILLDLLELL